FFGAAGGASRGPAPRGRRGQDALIRLEVELRDAVFGVEAEVQVDTAVLGGTCNGPCTRPGTRLQTCPVCHGRAPVQRVARSFLGNVMTTSRCPACGGHGTTIPAPCRACSGQGRVRNRRTIPVSVPAGVDTGNRIKLTGSGEVGPGG